MIVKIQRYSDYQQFWMIDNIKKISVSTFKVKNGLMDDDITIFDNNNKCTCKTDPCSTNSDGKVKENMCSQCCYLVLICRKDDGSEFSIAFDTIAYILNDNGKTIEKVVANYNLSE